MQKIVLNLLSQDKVKNNLAIIKYIAAGGISSLFILFFVRKSLPLEHRQARQYYRDL